MDTAESADTNRMMFAKYVCWFVTLVAYAQTPPQTFTFVPPSSLVGNSGAPYAADEIQEKSKSDPAGAPVTERFLAHVIFRDSHGRTRIETPVSHSTLRVAEIEDSVAGFKIVLDPQARVAHRLRVPHSNTYPISSNGLSSRPVGSDEALGTRSIEGFTAVGTRSTVQLKSGLSTIERWRIPELNVLVLVQTRLPRTGLLTTRLEHIHRDEPASYLFLIPGGYKIVDETATFSFALNPQ